MSKNERANKRPRPISSEPNLGGSNGLGASVKIGNRRFPIFTEVVFLSPIHLVNLSYASTEYPAYPEGLLMQHFEKTKVMFENDEVRISKVAIQYEPDESNIRFKDTPSDLKDLLGTDIVY